MQTERIDDHICNTILQIVEEENADLIKFNKGIFDMPELALTYLVGKKIANEILYKGYKWQRELTLNNREMTDLVFTYINNTEFSYAFEFKMDDTWAIYRNDVEKLYCIKDDANIKYKKYFCCLKWVLDNNQGEKFSETLNEILNGKASLINSTIFKTKIKLKETSCLFMFWKVF